MTIELGDEVTQKVAESAFGKNVLLVDLSEAHELTFRDTIAYRGTRVPKRKRQPHVFVRRDAKSPWTYFGRGFVGLTGTRQGESFAEITIAISPELFAAFHGGTMDVAVCSRLAEKQWRNVDTVVVADAAAAIDIARRALETHDPTYVHIKTMDRMHAELYGAGGRVGAVDYLSYATNARDPARRTWVAYGHSNDGRAFERSWDLAYALDAETALACAQAKLERTPLPEGYRWQDPEKKFPGELARRPRPKATKRKKVRLKKKDVPELFDLARWRACDKSRRETIADHVLAALGDGWQKRRAVRYGDTPILPFACAKVTFHLIPGGGYLKGLSETERETLAALDNRGDMEAIGFDAFELPQPVKTRVRPFLCASRPLTYPQARGLVRDDELQRGDLWDDQHRSTNIAFVTRAEARTVSRTLGMRLWSDDEAEWAIRGGRDSVFFWGDTCSDGDLELAMHFSFSDRNATGRRRTASVCSASPRARSRKTTPSAAARQTCGHFKVRASGCGCHRRCSSLSKTPRLDRRSVWRSHCSCPSVMSEPSTCVWNSEGPGSSSLYVGRLRTSGRARASPPTMFVNLVRLSS